MGSVATCECCEKGICVICATRVNGKTVCRDCAETLQSQTVPPGESGPEVQPVPETPATQAPEQAKPEANPAVSVPNPVPEPAPVTVPATIPVPSSQLQPMSQPVPPSPPAAPGATGAGGARAKESLLSAVMSLIIPGAGQAYNGEIKKGIILALLYIASFIVAISITVLFAMSAPFNGACCCLPVFVLPLIILVYAIYDAYETAEKINMGEPVKDWL